MRHIIAVLLENEAGALSRVVGLFAQRNYNIASLTVAPTEDGTLSRLTVTTEGDDSKIEQIMEGREPDPPSGWNDDGDRPPRSPGSGGEASDGEPAGDPATSS